MKDDKDKKYVVTQRVTIAKVPQKTKPTASKSPAASQKPRSEDNARLSANTDLRTNTEPMKKQKGSAPVKPGSLAKSASTDIPAAKRREQAAQVPETENDRPATPKKRVATVDNIMAPDIPAVKGKDTDAQEPYKEKDKPKKRVATVDNIMMPAMPKKSEVVTAPSKRPARDVEDELLEDEWDDEPVKQKNAKPRGGRESVPAWTLILLFAVIAVIAAILLFFFVLRDNDAYATSPSAVPTETVAPTPQPTPTATPTPTPTPEPTVTPEPTPVTMWGANFPGMFTTGEILKNDSSAAPTISTLATRFETAEVVASYKSEHVNVTVNKVKENGVTYFVSDIYITDLKYFTAPFSGGEYNKGSRKFVKDIAKDNNAIIAINGDFYTDNAGPVLRDGVLYRNEVYRDILVMLNDGTMKTYVKGEYGKDTVEELKDQAWQIWAFGPELIDKEGQPKTRFNSSVTSVNPRSAVGYYEPGHYCFVSVDGRQSGYSKGLDMKGLSRLMYDLGCKTAFNLDGGASAQLSFMGEETNRPSGGGRKDRDALCIIDEPAPEESAAPTAGN